jgi:hypothetical protein
VRHGLDIGRDVERLPPQGVDGFGNPDDPDLVAVHFYMGNDGPNLYTTGTWLRRVRWLPQSYLGITSELLMI